MSTIMRRSPSLINARLSKRIVCLTAAAAFSTLPSGSYAFAPGATRPIARPHHPVAFVTAYPTAPPAITLTQTRLYGGKPGGFRDTLKKGAKAVLPETWFKTEKEEQLAIERNRAKDEISGGLKEILKDAPLPIKILGGMIAPIMSKVVSSIGQSMKEQQSKMDELLQDARTKMVRDPAVAQALGEPIEVQAPFSQSSSTMSINGKSTMRTQVSFYVQGSYQTGVARMDATNVGISSLSVEVGGKTFNVNLSSKGPAEEKSAYSGEERTSNLGKNTKDQGDIIDVEFVEKK